MRFSFSAFDATSTTGLTSSGSAHRDLQSPTINRLRNEFAKSFLQPRPTDKQQWCQTEQKILITKNIGMECCLLTCHDIRYVLGTITGPAVSRNFLKCLSFTDLSVFILWELNILHFYAAISLNTIYRNIVFCFWQSVNALIDYVMTLELDIGIRGRKVHWTQKLTCQLAIKS